MARNSLPDSPGPRGELAVLTLPAFRGERGCDVGDGVGMRRELFEPIGPCRERRRRAGRDVRERAEGLREVPSRQGVAPAVVSDRARGGAGQHDAVGDPVKSSGDGHRSLERRPAGVRDDEEVAGKIAAIDR